MGKKVITFFQKGFAVFPMISIFDCQLVLVFSNMRQIEFDGIKTNIISLQDLIKCKKNSARLKDQADAEELEKLN